MINDHENMAALKELLQDKKLKQYLKRKPHPYKYMAERGKTRYDYVVFMEEVGTRWIRSILT